LPRNPYWGVSWNRQKKKFQAKLRLDHGERIHVGYFDSAIDAARAYNTEALRRVGQFATLADIDGDDWLERHRLVLVSATKHPS
jgi:hypothetical protein